MRCCIYELSEAHITRLAVIGEFSKQWEDEREREETWQLWTLSCVISRITTVMLCYTLLTGQKCRGPCTFFHHCNARYLFARSHHQLQVNDRKIGPFGPGSVTFYYFWKGPMMGSFFCRIHSFLFSSTWCSSLKTVPEWPPRYLLHFSVTASQSWCINN